MKEIFTTQSGNQINFDVGERFETNFNGSTILVGESEGKKLVAKFSAYPWGAQREWNGLQKVSAAGIPSPKPVAFIPGKRPGIITEYLHGESLKDNPDVHLRYDLGILVRQMHQGVQTEGNEWISYGKNDFSYYDKKIDKWKRSDIGGDAPDILKELAIDVGDSFRLIKPAFTHHDLYDNQVIINERDLFLFDFEFWRESHPLDDISVYLMNTIRTGANEEYFWQLCKGYIDTEGNYTEEQKKVIAFLLLFTSCQSLEFYQDNRPSDLNIPAGHHQEAISLVKRESLWKKL